MPTEGESLPIRLGVSSCLLGRPVRYDGGHKRDRFLTDVLAGFVDWVPVCPEVEAELGVPRPAMRLERRRGEVRLVEIASGRDHTRRLERFAAGRVRELRRLELCGYVLKRGSPSCGVTRVGISGEQAEPRSGDRSGPRHGLYASALIEAFPHLPIEEEGRLSEARHRECFIERVFAYRRLRALFRLRWTRRHLEAFHAAHELQLMSHAPSATRDLGRLVASSELPRPVLRERYAADFTGVLARPATSRRNVVVLDHAARQLKTRLDAAAHADLVERIADYRCGRAPLVVPITLLAHHARREKIASLSGQTYLEPHPVELVLRNRV